MIELDVTPERADPPEPSGWLAYQRSRLPLVFLLVAFVAGAVAGGGGVYYAGVLRPRIAAAEAAEAARAAAPQLLISRDPTFFETTPAEHSVRASGRIMVSNTGQAEVVVHAVSAEAGGLRMTTDVEKARWLQPGGTLGIDVTILFDCDVEAPVPASTRVLVEAPDGTRSEVGSAVDLASADWPLTYQATCAKAK
ncbi:hypothetical protein J2S43_005271 [Catenuloplanes nepalensis]|uniref:DUF3426 domain-containing protein n=1 Tax=Catenuloplanes nepalensis TaxID=587533 RepID=A0ABT9MZD6_9ACTN|nr:hypothetical protein [Catenuloplanes nepalensis]MDP9796759.1 hypothetical protein [Catenuloplanes nepalensis]